MSQWTFNSIAFDWLRRDENGHPAAPTWNREPRLVERPLLDSGDADVVRIGFTAWKISGGVFVEAADAAAFVNLNGATGLLSDGTTTWSAILQWRGADLLPTGAGITGTATFTRPRA